MELTGASLAYRLPHNQAGSLKETAAQLLRRQVHYEDLWALKALDVSIHRGEFFAVIGPNGAGKSTLMKLIARVLPPTEGRVVVRGSVAPMIELAAGLDVELTTVENVVLYGSLLGMTPTHMRSRVSAILEWAELGHVSDVPVRTYSSGMLARLGFAVATDVMPDVLVVDEVLGVGDERFQRKSLQRIMDMMSSGTTIVFVSHDLDLVRKTAQRVLWIDHGAARMVGPAETVVQAYLESIDTA